MKLLRRLEVEPILLPVLVKQKILNLNSLFDTWQKLDTFVSGCSFGEFNRQEMPVWEWNQSGTQLQQKEFQQTIKEREEKRKPRYKNSPAKCNYSEFGLLPSTPEGILLFAEFSECNLVPKEKDKKVPLLSPFSQFCFVWESIWKTEKLLYCCERRQNLAKQMFSARIRGTD